MRWLKSASSKHRMSSFVLTSIRLVGMDNGDKHRLTCDNAVRSMKRLAEENPWTIRGLFEARQRYLNGDMIGSLSLYLQLAYTGVEVAQANAAHILTKPGRGLVSWISTMFSSTLNEEENDVDAVKDEEFIVPYSVNARNEIAHDLYVSANRQGWKGAVPYICDINSKSPEDFFTCHSRAVDEARDPHSAFRVGTFCFCFYRCVFSSTHVYINRNNARYGYWNETRSSLRSRTFSQKLSVSTCER